MLIAANEMRVARRWPRSSWPLRQWQLPPPGRVAGDADWCFAIVVELLPVIDPGPSGDASVDAAAVERGGCGAIAAADGGESVTVVGGGGVGAAADVAGDGAVGVEGYCTCSDASHRLHSYFAAHP